ncbi:MAG: hypothetical protein IJ550_02175 [Bacteroidaceae bacterium]|nr:hypothetical protein [Bacteroidaceae bacterium]
MKVVKLLICFLLLVSCGSVKKAVKEDIDQTSHVESSATEQEKVEINASSEQSAIAETTTSEQTNDSTETMTVRETTWYDTSKVDSNGVSPVLKTEKQTSITYHGRRNVKDTENKGRSNEKQQSSATVQNSAKKEESAESAKKSQIQRDVTATETKQLQYLSWVLPGIAFVILAAVLAYWVFTKYRRR